VRFKAAIPGFAGYRVIHNICPTGCNKSTTKNTFKTVYQDNIK